MVCPQTKVCMKTNHWSTQEQRGEAHSLRVLSEKRHIVCQQRTNSSTSAWFIKWVKSYTGFDKYSLQQSHTLHIQYGSCVITAGWVFMCVKVYNWVSLCPCLSLRDVGSLVKMSRASVSWDGKAMLCFLGQGHLWQDLYSAFEEIGLIKWHHWDVFVLSWSPATLSTSSQTCLQPNTRQECCTAAEEMKRENKNLVSINCSN